MTTKEYADKCKRNCLEFDLDNLKKNKRKELLEKLPELR